VFYATKIKGFDLNKICFSTYLVEGNKEVRNSNQKIIIDLKTTVQNDSITIVDMNWFRNEFSIYQEMENLERRLLEMANKFGGFYAGEEYGKRGYQLTFVIAYIRVSLRFSLFELNFYLLNTELFWLDFRIWD